MKLKIKTLFRLLVVLFLISATSFILYYPIKLIYSRIAERSNILKVFVSYVVDGDTIRVDINKSKVSVRLIGIDCPELSDPREQVYAEESLEYTKKRLLNKEVWLEFDVQRKDRYGRLLAYIWFKPPNRFNEEEVYKNMFNAQIILDGYAKVYTYPPNVKYTDFFVKFQREAIENNAGLWNDDLFKEDTSSYYIGNIKSKVLHRPTCKWVQKISKYNRVKFKTKTEAILQGFSTCRECKP
jgi:micrococcal nuclease